MKKVRNDQASIKSNIPNLNDSLARLHEFCEVLALPYGEGKSKDLKYLCKNFDLRVGGTKQDLVNRLIVRLSQDDTCAQDTSAANEVHLTADQSTSFERLAKFFYDEENPAIVVTGSAGTGKTYLARHIVNFIIDNRLARIAAVAPTHKARRVLEKMLNQGRCISIPSFTTCSVLGKMR